MRARRDVESVGDEGFKKAPIGAGPYRVVSVNPGIEMTLEAFEGYWRKPPSVKRLVFRSLPDDTTQVQRVLYEHRVFAPVWENGFIRGVGPRVEEPALALIPSYPYSVPYEDVRLKP